MKSSVLNTLAIAGAVSCVGLVSFTGVAHADPSTGRTRVLDCGDAGSLTVELGPAQFVSTTAAAIHVIDSNAVLVPTYVEITTSDGTFVTLDKHSGSVLPGGVITCTYTDPAGFEVVLQGFLVNG